MTGELILYSGHEEEGAPHTEGVALMLQKQAQKSLIGWEAKGPRMMTASFTTKKRNIKLNIILCYAPTNDKSDEDKDSFYEELGNILEGMSNKDINILMGDFNAKIGMDNKGYEEVMGTHGLGEMNDNGMRFADTCMMNNLVIGGSMFPHKRIHKATWISPDHRTENQIDHICVSKKFRRSLQDVRVKRGADVGSDHHLVIARLKLKLRKNWTEQQGRKARFNINFLEDAQKQKDFQLVLSNRFQALQDIQEDDSLDLESQWKNFKEAVVGSCEEVVGRKTAQQKDWMSAETYEKIQSRKRRKAAVNTSRTRASKAKAQEEYNEAHKEVKASVKRDKRAFVDGLATEAEKAAESRNMRELYNTTKKLIGKYSLGERPVKDKNGKMLRGTDEQLNRWQEHFCELLNRPAPENPPEIDEAEEDLPISCDRPTRAEIRKAIGLLRNGKAPGPDEIPAEALKAGSGTMVEKLYHLFGKIWEDEEIPTDWGEGHLIKLSKKGDLGVCLNYRGITLLSVPGKVFNRVIME